MGEKTYLTYSEYQELGGTLPKETFTVLNRKAQRWLDYVTFDRIKYLTNIPVVIKEVLVEFVNKINDFENLKHSGGSGAGPLVQYSNGVEQLTYDVSKYNSSTADADFKKELFDLAHEWLPDWLTYRGFNYDVRDYIQRNSDLLEQATPQG